MVIANERVKVMGHAEYMNRAFTDRFEIVSDADEILANVHFDTFVGIGISGTLVAPLLADMGKGDHAFAIVRKDDSSHSSHKIEGELNRQDQFVFVDDLIDSGRTLEYVIDTIEEIFESEYTSDRPQLVGAYLYQNNEFLRIPRLIDRLKQRAWNVPTELIRKLERML